MNLWVAFAAGLVIGAAVGVFTAALCIAGGEEDQILERLRDGRP